MRLFSLILIAILLATSNAAASEGNLLTKQQWLEDLEFVVSKLKTQHPDPYYKISPAEFDSIAGESRNEITDSWSDVECYFAIKRLIATIEDGHTGLLENGVFNLLDLRFPFRVDEFTDGVYITVIDKEREKFLGSRLIAIDGKPIETILTKIIKVASSDNRFWRELWATNGISFARILYGMGVIDDTDHIEMELITKDGEKRKLTIMSRQDNSDVEFGWSFPLDVGPTEGEYVSLRDILGEKTPLYFKNQGRTIKYYWFEHLVDEKALYFQFNQIMNQPDGGETFAEFSKRMWDYIDEHAENIEKLIIDLRYNNGGNGVMLLPFLNEIIKREFINRKGSLFVISGKKTYSAASIFMYELAVHTNVLFVGEPDGCGADLFSNNSLAGNLPNSGFPLYIARLRFTCRWPVNGTEYFMPHFPASFSSYDYFSGNDPALDFILHGDLRSVADFAADEGSEAAFPYYKRMREKYADFDWWTVLDPEVLERSIDRKGYALMRSSDLERAFQVFMLNTVIFPDAFNAWDSLGECCYNLGRFNLSLQYYEKSIQLNPDNENGKKMIERVKNEMK